MPSASLTLLNFLQGNAGTSNGLSLFTDLSGRFPTGLVGAQLIVGGVSYPITQRLSSTTLQIDGGVPAAGSGLAWTMSLPLVNGQTITVPSSTMAGYAVELQATATNTEANATANRIQLDFDYGNATHAPSSIGTGSVTETFSFRYPAGSYRINATATNFRYPFPQSTTSFFTLIVLPAPASGQPSLGPSYSIIGPILPKDSGYPDAQEWNLNIDRDDQLLASNVKMLIGTDQGERVMNPGYGTAIRSTIFDMDPAAIQSFLQTQINTALTNYEPRAQLLGLSYSLDSNTRSATVLVQVLSLITRSVIPTSVTIHG